MECKAQRSYTVEHFAKGKTGWRCLVCGKMLRLTPGKDSAIMNDTSMGVVAPD